MHAQGVEVAPCMDRITPAVVDPYPRIGQLLQCPAAPEGELLEWRNLHRDDRRQATITELVLGVDAGALQPRHKPTRGVRPIFFVGAAARRPPSRFAYFKG